MYEPEDILDKIKLYMDDCRLLAAREEYDKLCSLSINNLKSDSIDRKIQSILINNTELFKTLIERSDKVNSSLVDLRESGDWLKGGQNSSVTSYYRIDSDGFLSLKLVGCQQNVPIFEQILVMYEVDFYKDWVPLCYVSNLVKRISKWSIFKFIPSNYDIDKGELVANIGMGIKFGPFRDLVAHCYAADCVYENGTVVLIGQSVDSFPGVIIPQTNFGYFGNRANLISMQAFIELSSPYSCQVVVSIKVDLKLPLPQSFLNYITQQVCGGLLDIVMKQANLVANSSQSQYSRAILNNRSFYIDWMLPKYRAYIHHMKWPQPKISSVDNAFQLELKEAQEEGSIEEHQHVVNPPALLRLTSKNLILAADRSEGMPSPAPSSSVYSSSMSSILSASSKANKRPATVTVTGVILCVLCLYLFMDTVVIGRGGDRTYRHHNALHLELLDTDTRTTHMRSAISSPLHNPSSSLLLLKSVSLSSTSYSEDSWTYPCTVFGYTLISTFILYQCYDGFMRSLNFMAKLFELEIAN